MTTIAYKNGIIAYDSRMMKGGIIISDKYKKVTERKGVYFFFAGSICDLEALIKCYFGGKSEYSVDCTAIVFDNGNLFHIGVFDDEKRIYKDPVALYITEAIGSGQQFALAYMDCGFSAEKAVKMTMGRDPYTGGEVHTFKLDDHKGCGGPENG